MNTASATATLQKQVAALESRIKILEKANPLAGRMHEFVESDLPPIYTTTVGVPEAARSLKLSEEQVRRHLRSGKLLGINRRGRTGWLVSKASLERFAKSRRG